MSDLTIWLHVTNACNIRCKYCFVKKDNDAMDRDVGHRAIRTVFKSAANHGYKRVVLKFAGGEPTLNFPLITELYDEAELLAEWSTVSLKGVVLSNGIGFSEQMIKDLIARNIKLEISLDSSDVVHNELRFSTKSAYFLSSTTKSILLAKQFGLTPHINITLTRYSAPKLPEYIDWLLDNELAFSINLYRKISGSNSLLDLVNNEAIDALSLAVKVIESKLPTWSLLGLLDQTNLFRKSQYPCSAGRNYMAINHHGHISKCHMILDQQITTIDSDDPLSRIQENDESLETLPVDTKIQCSEQCKWRYYCGGGCPVATYNMMRSYNRVSPYCSIYKVILPELLRVEKLRLKKYPDDKLEEYVTENFS